VQTGQNQLEGSLKKLRAYWLFDHFDQSSAKLHAMVVFVTFSQGDRAYLAHIDLK